MAGRIALSPNCTEGALLLARMADALPWPLLCVAPDGTWVHGNRAAVALLEGGAPLQLSASGRVQGRTARQRAALGAALARALAGEATQLHWRGAPPFVVQPLGGEPPAVLLAWTAPGDGQ